MNHYFVTTTLGRIYVQYVMWQIPKWNFLCLEGSRQAKLRLSLVSIVDSIEETWEGLQHNLTHLKGRSLWHNKWIKFVAAVTEEKQLREYYRAHENNQYTVTASLLLPATDITVARRSRSELVAQIRACQRWLLRWLLRLLNNNAAIKDIKYIMIGAAITSITKQRIL